MELLLGGANTLPGLDPNWFYSSITQSAAAIVGLLGAIFATRLQDQITTAREQRLATTQSLKDLHDRLISVRKPLAEYLEHTEAQLQFLRQHLSSGGQVERAPWYSPLEMASRSMVEVSDRMLRVEEDRTKDAKLLLPLVERALAGNSAADVHRFLQDLDSARPQFSSEHLAQHAGAFRDAAQRPSRELRILDLRSRTRPSWVLWACLTALSAFGVVIPLWFLSARAASHKVILLFLFGVALIVLLAYLASQVAMLGRSARWVSVLPPDDPELPA